MDSSSQVRVEASMIGHSESQLAKPGDYTNYGQFGTSAPSIEIPKNIQAIVRTSVAKKESRR